jgi:type IV secretion system protein VirB11
MDMIARHYVKILEEYIAKGAVKELCINKPEEVWIEYANGEWKCFKDERLKLNYLKLFIRSLATTSGQEFSERSPIVSLILPKGHRIQVVSGSHTKDKFALVLRVNRGIVHQIDNYDYGKVKSNISRLHNATNIGQIVSIFNSGANLLIAGGTGCGKTSFANSLFAELYKTHPNLRIVTIEGVSELVIPHLNCCSLLYSENNTAVGTTKVSDLLDAALRMRPDRLIVGELRGSNVSVFREVIDSGHSGVLATVHASTAFGAITAITKKAVRANVIESSAEQGFREELMASIDGIVLVKKVNHLPVIEYVAIADIQNHNQNHNDNNNHIKEENYEPLCA